MAGAVPATRDRYFDALRAVAIVRVVAYHMFPFAVLELAFPSMGVMFALAGSLMFKSMDRSAATAVKGRLRRLLPALWVMGLVLVPLMVLTGWPDRPTWPTLLLWVVPIADPPANDWGMAGAGVLWYLVTYLWLVVLSPLLRWCYRHAALATVVAPLALLVVVSTYAGPYAESALGGAGWVLTNVLTFGSCWLVGFAHRDGALRRLRPVVVGAIAAVCIGGSLGWAFSHPGEHGVSMVDIPSAYGTYCLGFVVLLMRWSPPMHRLAERRVLDGMVTLFNARAVTIYLWHNLAITAGLVLGERLEVWRLGHGEYVAFVAVSLLLLLDVVLLLGWVEDLAARRPVRMLPWAAAPKAGAAAARTSRAEFARRQEPAVANAAA